MSGMTFGPEDKTAAQILRDPTSSFGDMEAVARYIELLEGLFPRAFSHIRYAYDLLPRVSREEETILREVVIRPLLEERRG